MIQVGKLRPFFSKKTNSMDKGMFGFQPSIEASSIFDFIENIEEILAKIPESERWNCYYTTFNSKEKFRTFDSIEAIYFDIDYVDYSRLDQYMDVFFSTFPELDPNKTFVLASGYGLQFIVGLHKKITDINYFTRFSLHNKVANEKLQANIEKCGLPGNWDTSIFHRAAMMRMPLTDNRKEGRPNKMGVILRPYLEPQDFDLVKASGLPEVKEHEQVELPKINFETYDTQAILSGCEFIKWCKTNGNEVHEPHAYALFSIIGRFENGLEIAEDLVRGFTGSPTIQGPSWDTEKKLEQAVLAAGPRTCSNIQSLWDGCNNCAYHKKITSPISIKTEEHIATEKTGFHTVIVGKNGTVKRVPCFEDLKKFFERKHNYRTLANSKMVYVWNGKFYEYWSDAKIEGFAQEHFTPYAVTHMTNEFKTLVQRTNLVDEEWFFESTNGFMNFKNGVLNTQTLDFQPHSANRGFLGIIDYDYDPSATAPEFEKMMLSVCQGDTEKVQLILEFFGYAISNDRCWLQKSLVLEGEGSNGKSTLLEVLSELTVGPQNFTSSFMKELQKEEGRAHLDGKLFNIAEEVPSKAIADSTVFKALVTGARVKARKLYKDSYEFRNRTKLIFSCNDMPGSHDSSYGYLRRFVIVPMKAKFTPGTAGYDPNIIDKMQTQRAGIMNLLLESYRTLRERGRLSLPASVTERLERYKEEVDYTGQWIEDRGLVEVPNGHSREVPLNDIYQTYVFDMKNDGLYAMNKKWFARKLHETIVDPDSRITRKMINGVRERFVKIESKNDGPKITGTRFDWYAS